MHELDATKRYGGDLSDARVAEILTATAVESPPGRSWEFTPFPPSDRVAPIWIDSRFPGARMSAEGLEMPLALLLGQPCRKCDEAGETVCSTCSGTGTHFRAWDESDVPCPVKQVCFTCASTKFRVNSGRVGVGPCRHSNGAVLEFKSRFAMNRCMDCGLASITAQSHFHDLYACGACGHFDCVCATGTQ